jgi:hypothetical protein
MKTLLRSLILLSAILLATGSALAADVSIGIQIGAPPPPRVLAVRPASPGPDWVWVEGYWYPVNGRYRWHDGYWTRPPYAGAIWVGPHHDGQRYFNGYWEGPRGRYEHDHRWDRDHDRDFRRERRDRDDHDRR